MVNADHSLVDELEEVIASNGIGHRARILKRMADLFAMSSGKLSEEQMAPFGDVMDRLIDEINFAACPALGNGVAELPNTSQKVARRLALGDAIRVAEPILSRLGCVGDEALVEEVMTRTQTHFPAISLCRILVESVTDILADSKNRNVVLSAAGNHGAASSESGYATLVQLSADNGEPAVRNWLRPEIPRQHFLKLFADAAESVKFELANKDPCKAGFVTEAVAQVSSRIQARIRESSARYAAAYSRVRSLYETNELNESRLAEFANSAQFDETVIALSLMSDLHINLVEHAFISERSEQLIVLAKANEMSWETTKSILLLQNTVHGLAPERDMAFEIFKRLKVKTARKAIGFYRLRERAMTQRFG